MKALSKTTPTETKASSPGGRPETHVSLIGFMGSGKTTIGKYLAASLAFKFLDLDQILSSRFEVPVFQIFSRIGEPGFRKAESEELVRVFSSEANLVLATGGGAILLPENRSRLKNESCCVFLDPPFEFLKPKIRSTPGLRPLADGIDDGKLEILWGERRALYLETAHIVITSTASPEKIATEIMEHYEKQFRKS